MMHSTVFAASDDSAVVPLLLFLLEEVQALRDEVRALPLNEAEEMHFRQMLDAAGERALALLLACVVVEPSH